ncbi:hypothetical protein [Komagataeibacter nataicola]|nr:hypothetical protein [Komagataeibacter nataicola]
MLQVLIAQEPQAEKYIAHRIIRAITGSFIGMIGVRTRCMRVVPAIFQLS